MTLTCNITFISWDQQKSNLGKKLVQTNWSLLYFRTEAITEAIVLVGYIPQCRRTFLLLSLQFITSKKKKKIYLEYQYINLFASQKAE